MIVDGQAIEGPSLDRAVIFQSHALLPWRTVHGQRRLRGVLEMAALESRADQRACAEIHRSRRAHRLRAQAAGGAFRRHEAARRHCARALDRAEDHADGRAVLGARRAHARHAAGRGPAHLSRDRADRVHDHARCRRGDLPRRPDRPDDQRPRRRAGRDRRESAAEEPPAQRHPPPPALLRGAQPHHRFSGQPQQDFQRGNDEQLRSAPCADGASGRSGTDGGRRGRHCSACPPGGVFAGERADLRRHDPQERGSRHS